MSDPATRAAGWTRRFSIALLLALVASFFALTSSQARADEPAVPEDVAAYFATGLVPRLADLYGSPGSTDPESTFDDTTKVGTIHRLLAWTPDFLAGHKTDSPTQLTNTWIAPVTAKEGTILGLAAVWINPGNDVVELADFSRGRALVDALGRAPKDTKLIDDTAQQAWFATDGKTLTPLVVGSSGTRGPLTPDEYQKILVSKAKPAKAPEPVTNPGLLIAGITLGAVVLLLAVFILLPGRRRKTEAGRDAVAKPRRNPRDESDKAFDREASLTEARAVSRARAAVAAEAGLVDAIAESEAHPVEAAPPEEDLHAEPDTVKPDTVKPDTVKPDTVKPDTVKPAPAEPAKLAPVKPGQTKPATAKPPVPKATNKKPVSAKRTTAKPTTAKPAAVKPAVPKATKASPAAVRSTPARAAAKKPSATKPTLGKQPAAKKSSEDQ